MSRPCIFFDRDGVVNTAPDASEYYVLSPDRLFIEDGWLAALRVVNDLGFAAVIVTNQKCVHKGLLTREELDAIHQEIWDLVAKHGLALDAVYAATRGDADPDAKPKPGMLLKAAEDHDLDLARSWMVGDSERDIEAGQAAGCAGTMYVGAGETGATCQVAAIKELASMLQERLTK